MGTAGKRASVGCGAATGGQSVPGCYNPAMPDSPVLVITGASSGIGAATARRAVEFDYRVVLAARSQEKLEGWRRSSAGRSARWRCAAT